jgi:Ca-activated chloride channel homolog
LAEADWRRRGGDHRPVNLDVNTSYLDPTARDDDPGEEERTLYPKPAGITSHDVVARVRVGPYYTNTREGLRLSRRILERQKKDMRQIVMITDGKPSAVTLPDGRVYRNPMGLDHFVLRETFAEVGACRKAGIPVNTFMLARDPALVAFVEQLSRIARGRAYFTSTMTLGQHIMRDFLRRKTRRAG